ncbi:hypothetical protein AMECASPLE_038426, partial [Ameca splendens]
HTLKLLLANQLQCEDECGSDVIYPFPLFLKRKTPEVCCFRPGRHHPPPQWIC